MTTELLFTEKHPNGVEIRPAGIYIPEGNPPIEYIEIDGFLTRDGRSFTVAGKCDHEGWHYSVSIEGEDSDLLVNPKTWNGQP